MGLFLYKLLPPAPVISCLSHFGRFALIGDPRAIRPFDMCILLYEPPWVYRRVKFSKAEPCGQQEIPPKYTADLRERGVRLFRQQRLGYDSDNAAHKTIASNPGCPPDTLRARCVQAARDAGERDGATAATV